MGRNFFSRYALAACAAATISLSACGGGAGSVGGGTMPSAPGAPMSMSADALSKRTPTPSPVPTPTPVPFPTTSPASLPVISDVDSSTAGVFLGAVCDRTSMVSCPNFATTFRHSVALGTIYSDWTYDLAGVIKNNNFAAWEAQGITPEITWEPTNISFTDINNGLYDAYMTTTANELKAFGGPIFLRPFHEFNGTWYTWGLANQGASSAADAAFIAAWQRMVTIFHNAGATNVKFVWCFSAGALGSVATEPWSNPAAAYPGDAYVDWISFDTYNRGNLLTGSKWKSFDQIVQPPYQLAYSIAPSKPIAISEIASNEYGDSGVQKTYWVTQMLDELSAPNNPYPNVKLLSWFESDLKGYVYDLQSTNPVFTAFANGIRGTDANGHLYFRSNGAALANVVTP